MMIFICMFLDYVACELSKEPMSLSWPSLPTLAAKARTSNNISFGKLAIRHGTAQNHGLFWLGSVTTFLSSRIYEIAPVQRYADCITPRNFKVFLPSTFQQLFSQLPHFWNYKTNYKRQCCSDYLSRWVEVFDMYLAVWKFHILTRLHDIGLRKEYVT